ncbi:hypothetical protein Tco_0760490 [Tanacetum coccineum]
MANTRGKIFKVEEIVTGRQETCTRCGVGYGNGDTVDFSTFILVRSEQEDTLHVEWENEYRLDINESRRDTGGQHETVSAHTQVLEIEIVFNTHGVGGDLGEGLGRVDVDILMGKGGHCIDMRIIYDTGKCLKGRCLRGMGKDVVGGMGVGEFSVGGKGMEVFSGGVVREVLRGTGDKCSMKDNELGDGVGHRRWEVKLLMSDMEF